MGTVDTPSAALGVAVAGSYAYVADSSSGLQIVDVTDPLSPVLAASVDTPDSAYGVTVAESYAYVADDSSGLQVIQLCEASLCTDTDSDGVCDDEDNCPDVINPDQTNSDADSLGDTCDNCPNADNEDQADSDGDSMGDACDVCPNDADNDADGDGVCGDVDNCPGTANADQADTDADGVGDACDACDDEDATGLDADLDGCIDTISGLDSLIQTLVEEGVVDELMQNSLLSKVGNAEKSADKENICAAVNQLEALKNQVDAQRGNKIADEAADLVNTYADNIITQLLDQLPLGESC